jgi:hypothetical protein
MTPYLVPSILAPKGTWLHLPSQQRLALHREAGGRHVSRTAGRPDDVLIPLPGPLLKSPTWSHLGMYIYITIYIIKYIIIYILYLSLSLDRFSGLHLGSKGFVYMLGHLHSDALPWSFLRSVPCQGTWVCSWPSSLDIFLSFTFNGYYLDTVSLGYIQM